MKRSTPEEIEDLKCNWAQDPCFELDRVEGFEAHWPELKAFAEEQEKRWEEEYRAKLEAKALELGVPGNLKLAKYILNLEKRLGGINNE